MSATSGSPRGADGMERGSGGGSARSFPAERALRGQLLPRLSHTFECETGEVMSFLMEERVAATLARFARGDGDDSVLLISTDKTGAGLSLLRRKEDVTDGMTTAVFALRNQHGGEVVCGELPLSGFLSWLPDVLEEVLVGAVGVQDPVDGLPDLVSRFSDVLKEAQMLLADALRLEEAVEGDAADPLRAAELVRSWKKTLSAVLAERDWQYTSRYSTTTASRSGGRGGEGPSEELLYWKKRLVSCQGLASQLAERQRRRVAAAVCKAGGSLAASWEECMARFTATQNEATDNVKYLYSIDRLMEPLYSCGPPRIMDALPGLVRAIGWMSSISRFYNTSERLTTLFSKVTNQLIRACRTYIAPPTLAARSLWDWPRRQLIGKLQMCIRLHAVYRDEFLRTKAELRATLGGRQFDVGPAMAFGQFEAFCERLRLIISMLDTAEQFCALDASLLPGLAPVLTTLDGMLEELRRSRREPLEHRSSEFTVLADRFVERAVALEEDLRAAISAAFEAMPGTLRALRTLRRLRRLAVMQRPVLQDELLSKYTLLFHRYGDDLLAVQRLYERQRTRPPLPRDSPPVSGNIAWAQQLHRRIERPMTLFKEQPAVFRSSGARRIVRRYNRLCSTLVEFVERWRAGWVEAVAAARAGVHATLLVAHPVTGAAFVNFDRQIVQLIKETRALRRMGLSVPPAALFILQQQGRFQSAYDGLTHMLSEYRRLLDKVPPLAAPLLRPRLARLRGQLRPGMEQLTWSSMGISDYLAAFLAQLAVVEDVVDKMNDILGQADAALDNIRATVLYELPNTVLTVNALVERAERSIARTVPTLQAKNVAVEAGMRHLRELLLPTAVTTSTAGAPGVAKALAAAAAVAGSSTTAAAAASAAAAAGSAASAVGDDKAGKEEEGKSSGSGGDDDAGAAARAKPSLTVEIASPAHAPSRSAGTRAPASPPPYSHAHTPSTPAGAPPASPGGGAVGAAGGMAAVLSEEESEEAEEVQAAMPALLQHYESAIFTAVKTAILSSLRRLRARFRNSLASRWGSEPVFQVDIEMKIPDVVLNPSLDDIQACMNKTAKAVLSAAAHVRRWGQMRAVVEVVTMFDDVARSMDILKVVLQLTGTFSGLRKRVQDYLRTFHKYDFLWKEDVTEIVSAFLLHAPTLDDFEREIQRLHSLGQEIAAIPAQHTIESLSLQSRSIKYSLAAEANRWKHAYGASLNEWAASELDALVEFVEESSVLLKSDVKDLADLRSTMASLQQLREMESEVELKIAPILDAHALLERYAVSVPSEDVERLAELQRDWKRLKELASSVSDHLLQVQPMFKRRLLQQLTAFHTDVAEFRLAWDARGPTVRGISVQESTSRLGDFRAQFDERDARLQLYQAGADLFGLPPPQSPDLLFIRRELKVLTQLYTLLRDVNITINGYLDTLWVSLDFRDVEERLANLHDRCRRLPRALKTREAYIDLSRAMNNLSGVLPVLVRLSEKSILKRHWLKLEEITGHSFPDDRSRFTLRQLLEAPILAHKDVIETMCSAAQKEAAIEVKLGKVKDEWVFESFVFSAYKTRGNIVLSARETTALIIKLEDSQQLLGALMTDRYNEPFKKEIVEWLRKLTSVGEVVDNWLAVQSLWKYLEAVFSGGDIAQQMPMEATRFRSIDRAWVKIVNSAAAQPNVLKVCYSDDSLQTILPYLQEQLEMCQKSLSGYLENKRSVFPRFYFVSDSILLEILAQGSDPLAVQPHLKNMFGGLARAEFARKAKGQVEGMRSSEGEVVRFTGERRVLAGGQVEDWLTRLEAEMRGTVRDISCEAVKLVLNEEEDRLSWVAAFPAQVCLLGYQAMWTADCSVALSAGRHDKAALAAATRKTVIVLRELLSAVSGSSLAPLERVKLEALITLQVHQRDSWELLLHSRARSLTDFEWLRRCRTYWREDREHFVLELADVPLDYCYEYLGCQQRLVITPLTERCYITLSQAINLHLGGSPLGPAGTGKTETVKDLARCLGKFVVVFNCSDQMDYRILGTLFKGIAQSGAWACFDEFNRIRLDVLSVVAQQISCCLTAVRERADTFVFTDGRTCRLAPGSGIFVTMNPGYAGRQELPESLKVLFRSMAMIKPDREIIMKVRMAASGFLSNAQLSVKFNLLYEMAEEQLSQQHHYDFGLRNVLSVLRMMGMAKREAAADVSETDLFVQTVRDVNLPKLVAEDEPLFLSLLSDLFPSLPPLKPRDDALEAAISSAAARAGLVLNDAWKLKIKQLYETSRVRWGIMVMGPAWTGKSTALSVLLEALETLDRPQREVRLNPKSITAAQMFGSVLDPRSNDWVDGIFSQLWRRSCGSKKDTGHWITLDGPVDSLWIENLNTVLDDNRSLSLANGERIPMAAHLKLAFEVSNIDNASPATVSRCGMIFLSPSTLGWAAVLEGSLRRRVRAGRWAKAAAATVLRVVTSLLPAWQAVVEGGSGGVAEPVMPVQLSRQVGNLLALLDGSGLAWLAACERLDTVARATLFCLSWALAGLLTEDGRAAFSSWASEAELVVPPLASIVQHSAWWLSDEDGPAVEWVQGERLQVTLPSDGSLFDFYVTPGGSWAAWGDLVVEVPPAALRQGTLLVPTAEGARLQALLGSVGDAGGAVMLIGSPGCGKSSLMQRLCSMAAAGGASTASIPLTAATSPAALQARVEALLEKRIGHTYGPAGGGRMVLFVDDLALPVINEWGDQPAGELLRQLMEAGGFYNLDRPGEWDTVEDVRYVAAMATPGGPRAQLAERLHARFFSLYMPPLGSDVVSGVALALLSAHFARSELPFAPGVAALLPQLSVAMQSLLAFAADALRPTPATPHYLFHMRDIRRICSGMWLVEPAAVDGVALMLSLWRHECLRVLGDRLVTHGHSQLLEDEVRRQTDELVTAARRRARRLALPEDSLFVDFMAVRLTAEEEAAAAAADAAAAEEAAALDGVAVAVSGGGSGSGRGGADSIGLAGMLLDDELDFDGDDEADDSAAADRRAYASAGDWEDVAAKLAGWLGEYNSRAASLPFMGHSLDLVLFEQSVRKLCCLNRMLRQPGGNAMLVGVGGVGKGSAAKLAAFMAGRRLVQLPPSQSYSTALFLEDLKKQYKACAVGGERVAYLMRDSDVDSPGMLDVLHSLLCSGDIVGLFSKEELDGMLMELRHLPEVIDVEGDMPALAALVAAAGGNVTLAGAGSGGASGSAASMDAALAAAAAGGKEEEAAGGGGGDAGSGGGGTAGSDDDDGALALTFLRALLVARLRSNMRFLFCFTSVGDGFRARVRAYPGLLAHTSVLWFQAWPTPALVGVGHSQLGGGALGAELDAGLQDRLVRTLAAQHEATAAMCEAYRTNSGRARAVTSKSFLHFLALYRQTYRQRATAARSRASALRSGLDRLAQAGVDVEVLNEELAVREAELQRKGDELAVLLDRIRAQTAQAEVIKVRVEVERERVAAEKEAIDAELAVVMDELAAAEPELVAAREALDAIEPADIHTLKKLPKPPNLIKRILDAVLILLGQPIEPVAFDALEDSGSGAGSSMLSSRRLRPSWEESVRMMGDSRFLDRLLRFDKDALNEETVELLEPYLAMPDFQFAQATRSSGNVAGLCVWVRAMARYYWVAKATRPKQAAVARQQALVAMKQAELEAAEAVAAEKKAALDEITAAYEAAVSNRQALQEELDGTRGRIGSARALLTALKEERLRWGDDLTALAESLHRLVGDAALVAAFVAYSGAFNGAYREKLTASWAAVLREAAIPSSEVAGEPVAFLFEGHVISSWQLEGLPAEPLAVQNGAIVTASKLLRAALLIDPQGQGQAWIAAAGRSAGLIAVSMDDGSVTVCKRSKGKKEDGGGDGTEDDEDEEGAAIEAAAAAAAAAAASGSSAGSGSGGGGSAAMNKLLRQAVEVCVEGGRPLLVTGIGEELPEVVEPVVDALARTSGLPARLSLGDRELLCCDGFWLVLTTRLPSPRLSPDVAGRTTVVDFTVTPAGLEEQLLASVIQRERAELEAQRAELLQEVAGNRARASALADELLELLSASTGNLLEDTTLMDLLTEIKSTVTDIRAQIAGAMKTSQALQEAREEFRPVAVRGSVLYFVIAEVGGLCPLYQTSLQQFLSTFGAALDAAEPSAIVPRRVHNIIATCTLRVYAHFLRGLLGRHKRIFQLLLAARVAVSEGGMTAAQLALLVRGGSSLSMSDAPQRAELEWLPPAAWLHALALQRSGGAFTGLVDDLVRRRDVWEDWWAAETPEELVPLVGKAGDSLLARLLLVRAFRPDRLPALTLQFVKKVLGEQFTTSSVSGPAELAEDAGPTMPVLYLLSQGNEPTAGVRDCARNAHTPLAVVPMGQGQEEEARRVVAVARSEGTWVLLQNCHLNVPFMSELAAMLADGHARDEFRLWATTEATVENFPLRLVHSSLIASNDPPRGLKAGLRRAAATVMRDQMHALDFSGWRSLLYTLCFMHVVVQERRKYGWLGWNVPYEFSESDLSVSVQYLRNYLDRHPLHKPLGWGALRYMICDVMYGGRITDDLDQRLMSTFGNTWLDARVFHSGFSFFPGYTIPDVEMVDEVVAHIDELPALDPPDICGLHPNADLSYQAREAEGMLSEMVALQHGGGDAVRGKQAESAVQEMAARLLRSLPAVAGDKELVGRCARMGAAKPVTLFVKQETLRMRRLLNMLTTQLQALLAALSGAKLMDSKLEALMECLHAARVPADWLAALPESTGIAFWMDALVQRAEQLQLWLADGALPSVWLGGLFNPAGFLNALKQEVTKTNRTWSLDSVNVHTEVTRFYDLDDVPYPPPPGTLLHGIMLEGCGWSKRHHRIGEAAPRVLFDALPMLRVTMTTVRAVDAASSYRCPLYLTPHRRQEDIVMFVPLPTEQSTDHWVLRGVALVCSVPEGS